MFARFSAAIVLALPVFAAATAIPRQASPSNQCNTGPVQCCNSVQNANSGQAAALLGLLGVALSAVTGQVGVTCSPLTAVGLGASSCSSQPVCCTNNSFNGVVALGCTPINVGL